MGHFYSKVKGHKSKSINIVRDVRYKIKIQKISVKIENKATQIDERSSAVLKYRTPHFRASATVRLPPLEKGEAWKIGWIQACTNMKFHNTYGNLGHSSWEFPELTNGKKIMISDSDGKNFPWYGSKNEVVLVKGPQTVYTLHKISMNDNFYPHVTWDIPTSSQRIPRLTNIKRDQTFFTWLVAMDVINYQFIVLRTYKWRMFLEISVDPSKELGQRAKLISDPEPIQPELLNHNLNIPNCAIYPSNANTSQVLVWRPRGSHPLIVVSSKCMSAKDYIKDDNNTKRIK